MSKKYIVTNFAYGTGPYLRTTELALAFNDELERRGKERLGVIVPLVYGEKQKRIMLEEFFSNADEIFLDEKLGALLKSIFYGDIPYKEALQKWSGNVREVSEEARKYLSGKIQVISLSGKAVEIDGGDIVLELNRSPRIRYDVAPAYSTTFGYIGEILENVQNVSAAHIAIDRELLNGGIKAADWVEGKQNIRAVAYPATFSWDQVYRPRYTDEVLTPPIMRPYAANTEEFEPGIFVTITGIPGLERLYEDARRLGLKLYSNDVNTVPGSIKKLPHVIPNKNTIFQFARSGWGSVWLSMISGTPLVVPDFDPKDDPEIYFNNLAVKKLGIGIVYRGQKLEEILVEAPKIKANSKKLCDEIIFRWGTLDGNQYCAKIFAEAFIRARN